MPGVQVWASSWRGRKCFRDHWQVGAALAFSPLVFFPRPAFSSIKGFCKGVPASGTFAHFSRPPFNPIIFSLERYSALAAISTWLSSLLPSLSPQYSPFLVPYNPQPPSMGPSAAKDLASCVRRDVFINLSGVRVLFKGHRIHARAQSMGPPKLNKVGKLAAMQAVYLVTSLHRVAGHEPQTCLGASSQHIKRGRERTAMRPCLALPLALCCAPS